MKSLKDPSVSGQTLSQLVMVTHCIWQSPHLLWSCSQKAVNDLGKLARQKSEAKAFCVKDAQKATWMSWHAFATSMQVKSGPSHAYRWNVIVYLRAWGPYCPFISTSMTVNDCRCLTQAPCNLYHGARFLIPKQPIPGFMKPVEVP